MWAARPTSNGIEPTELHLSFIKESETFESGRQNEERKQLEQMAAALAAKELAQQREATAQAERADAQRREAEQSRRVVLRTYAFLAVAIALAGVALAAAWTAGQEKKLAQLQSDRATRSAAEAIQAQTIANKTRDEALLQQSQYLVDRAQQEIWQENTGTGLALALEALPDTKSDDPRAKTRPYWANAEVVLDDALRSLRELAVLKGHTGTIGAVAISTNGNRIVTASSDRTARVWQRRSDSASGAVGWETATVLQGHQGSVTSAAMTSSGDRVVTGSVDRTAMIWDSASGQRLAHLKGHAGEITSVAVTSDGQWVATGSKDRTARIWNGRDGSFITEIKGHASGLTSVAISPDGTRLATASTDRTARLWNVKSGQQFASFEGHTGEINSLAMSGDASRIVTGSNDSKALVWDNVSKRPIVALSDPEPQRSTDLYFLFSSRANAADAIIEARRRYERIMVGFVSGAISPEVLQTAREQNAQLEIFVNVPGGSTRKAWTQDALSRANATAASVGIDTSRPDWRALWDEWGWKAFAFDELERFQREGFSAAELGPLTRFLGKESTRLLAFYTDYSKRHAAGKAPRLIMSDLSVEHLEAVVRDVNSGALPRAMFAPFHISEIGAGHNQQKQNAISSLIGIRTISYLDAPDQDVSSDRSEILSVAMAQDGSRVVTGSAGGVARMWNVSTGTQLVTFAGHVDSIRSIAISADGLLVVPGSNDNTARVWDAGVGTQHAPDRQGSAVLETGLEARIERAKGIAPRCLNREQRKQFYMAENSPRWCAARQLWPHDAVTIALDHLAHGRSREALAALQEAIRLDPVAAVTYKREQAAEHQRIARGLVEQGKPAEALVSAEAAVVLAGPEVAPALAMRGHIYLVLDHCEQALTDLDRALAIGAEDPSVHLDRGVCLEKTKKPDQAIAAFRSAIELSSEATSGVIAKARERLTGLGVALTDGGGLEPTTPAAALAAVGSWGYQLQGNQDSGVLLGVGELANAAHDMLVIDFSKDGLDTGRYPAEDIQALKRKADGGRRVIFAYMNVGEASDYRSHWRTSWTETGRASGRPTASAPTWLGPNNPSWQNSSKVRYWESGWQTVIFNEARTGWLDQIAAQGFDGAYLDIMDAYMFWGSEIPDADRRPGDPKDDREAARRMIAFIQALTRHVRTYHPGFLIIQQNSEMLLDTLGDPGSLEPLDVTLKAALLEAVSGLAVEDVYFPGDKPENNLLRPMIKRIEWATRDYAGNGKPVFSVEYINDPVVIEAYRERAGRDGFVLNAAPRRNLDRLAPPVAPLKPQ